MRVVTYSPTNNSATKRLKKVIRSCAKDVDKKFLTNIDKIPDELIKPRDGATALVLNIADEKEFSSIFSIKDYLWDVKVILVLPDTEDRTLSKGLKLYPRYYTYADNDFSDLSAVLEKMIASCSKDKKTGWQLLCGKEIQA